MQKPKIKQTKNDLALKNVFSFWYQNSNQFSSNLSIINIVKANLTVKGICLILEASQGVEHQKVLPTFLQVPQMGPRARMHIPGIL